MPRLSSAVLFGRPWFRPSKANRLTLASESLRSPAMSTITPERRRKLAAEHGLSDAYLYQCLTARRDMDAAEARRVETITGGEIRRWMVRRDWHLIWPELIGTEGAPAVAVGEVSHG